MRYFNSFITKSALFPKLSLSIFLLLVSTLSAEAKLNDFWGPEIGLNLNNMIFSPSGTNSYTKAGFKIGLTGDRNISEHVSLQGGLFLSQMGGKMDVNVVFVGPVSVPISIYYVQVPLNVIYRTKIGPGNIFGGIGPYFGYAISISSSASDTSFKTDNLNIGTGSNSFIKALDIGANACVGYELPLGLFARVSYGMSITNIAAESGNSIRNSNIGISLGWFFKGKSRGKN